MNVKIPVVEKSLAYLDTHTCGETLLTGMLGVILTPEEIGRAFKDAHVASHQIHRAHGNLDAASAALHLAAKVREGMAMQENTFKRRAELSHGIVLSRRSNLLKMTKG